MFNIFNLFSTKEDKKLNLLIRIKNQLDILEIKFRLLENKIKKMNKKYNNKYNEYEDLDLNDLYNIHEI
tara:strand:- start:2 stop:208 length:207 start_codon:yes stop_codon:yes gene_type:complete